ncbi:MAG TPA: HAD family phosphatase [Candidatus Limnocylindrales bacterium]|nr:HAD family phosphatase [Candidatus Limnocylindrales bacterium]
MNSRGQAAAFFDLDGTLLPSPSLEWRFLLYLLDRDHISSTSLRQWLSRFAKTILWNRRAAIEENKLYLAGLPESLVEEWQKNLVASPVPFFADGLGRLAWHQAKGHLVFLVSGTLAPLARAAANQLPGRVEICSTELDTMDGRWTGIVNGEHRSGEAKARAIQDLASKFGLALEQSYAYGNDWADFPMLASVGSPCAVNPSARLKLAARKRGWPICSWSRMQPFVRNCDVGLAVAGKI